MPHSEAAQAIIDRRDRERRERWDGQRAMYDSAYTKGDYKLAEPGAECWSVTEGELRQIRMNPEGEPLGGLIVEITTDPDEDGDLHRAYLCFDYTLGNGQLWRAFVRLQEAQVEPHSFGIVRPSLIRTSYRRLCREVGQKLEGRHEATAAEIEMVTNAAKIAAIFGQMLP